MSTSFILVCSSPAHSTSCALKGSLFEWEKIPFYTQKSILAYLDDPKDLASFERTSKSNREQNLVENYFKEHFPSLPGDGRKVYGMRLHSMPDCKRWRVREEAYILYGKEEAGKELEKVRRVIRYIKYNKGEIREKEESLTKEDISLLRAIFYAAKCLLEMLTYRNEENDVYRYYHAKLKHYYGNINANVEYLQKLYRKQAGLEMTSLCKATNEAIKARAQFFIFKHKLLDVKDLGGLSSEVEKLLLEAGKNPEGKATTMFTIGEAYEEGGGLENNGIDWYKENFQQDDNKAFEWYEKAAKKGSVKAQFKLGKMYFEGRAAGANIQDINKAIEFWEEAAGKGDADAQAMLGLMYVTHLANKELPFEESEKWGVFWWGHAAINGHNEAAFHLSQMYKEGRGSLELDLKKADFWLRKFSVVPNSSFFLSLEEQEPREEKGLTFSSAFKRSEVTKRIPKSLDPVDDIALTNAYFAPDNNAFNKIMDIQKKRGKLQRRVFLFSDLFWGYMYEKGPTVPKDEEKAIRYYIAAMHEHKQYALEGLSRVLSYNTSLTSINFNLANKILGDEGIAILAKGLKKNKGLTSLNLTYQHIGAKGCKALKEILADNNHLMELTLKDHDSIGEEESIYLADALKLNTSLQILDLSQNKIGDRGLTAFAQGLIYNNSLTSLNLKGIVIDDFSPQKGFLIPISSYQTILTQFKYRSLEQGLKKLAAALKANITLKHLNLASNEIASELRLNNKKVRKRSLEHIKSIIENSRSLTQLDLHNNKFTNQEIEELNSSSKRNPSLGLKLGY